MSRYAITTGDQSLVRELATIGASQEDIAAKICLPVQKVQKLFKHELRQGAAEGKELALKKLHEIAIAGENFPALSFYIKARCGWRDTGTPSGTVGIVRQIVRFGRLENGRARPTV